MARQRLSVMPPKNESEGVLNNREAHAAGYKRWTSRRYELMSLTPVTGYVAVFVQDADDGAAYLETESVDAVGLANVTTHFHELPPGWKTSREHRERETEVEPVTLILMDGGWEICEEAFNFAGLARSGNDITKVNSQLNYSYLKRLRPNAQKKADESVAADSPAVNSTINPQSNGEKNHGPTV